MKTEKLPFEHEGATYEAHVAYDPELAGPRPAVLVAHAWGGQGDFERAFAEGLTHLGYVGVSLDVYGRGVYGGSPEANEKLMMPMLGDRDELGRRLLANVGAARALPMVDSSRVAAVGFCFGGLCVLDLARRGVDLAGVVAFHGILHPLPVPTGAEVTAKVLALHGYDDPMARPEQLLAFAKEMSEAGADWQVHAYGHTLHAFTNPEAKDRARGTVYDPKADRRSRAAMAIFLRELFELTPMEAAE